MRVEQTAVSEGWESSTFDSAFLCLHCSDRVRTDKAPLQQQCPILFRDGETTVRIVCRAGTIVGIAKNTEYQIEHRAKNNRTRCKLLRCILLTDGEDDEEIESDIDQEEETKEEEENDLGLPGKLASADGVFDSPSDPDEDKGTADGIPIPWPNDMSFSMSFNMSTPESPKTTRSFPSSPDPMGGFQTLYVSPIAAPKGLILPKELDDDVFDAVKDRVQWLVDQGENAQWMRNKELPDKADRDNYAKANTMRMLAGSIQTFIEIGRFVGMGIQQYWTLVSLDLWEEDSDTRQELPQGEPDFVGHHIVIIVLEIKGSYRTDFEPEEGSGLPTYSMLIAKAGICYATGEDARWRYRRSTVVNPRSSRVILRIGTSA